MPAQSEKKGGGQDRKMFEEEGHVVGKRKKVTE